MRIGVTVDQSGVSGVAINGAGRVLNSAASALDRHAETPLAKSLISVLAKLSEPSGSPHTRRTIASVTFDLSGALTSVARAEPTVAVRISPRAPIDPIHELTVHWVDAPLIQYAAGGCTTLGEPLVPLDDGTIRQIADRCTPGARFVVTGVGAVVNPEQELRAGEILLEHAAPSSIEYSHHFPSSSFAIRERTALLNSQTIPTAERLVTELTLATEGFVPAGRLYAATNSGGCIPLQRIALEPAHSLFSGTSSEFIGAAALLGVADGPIAVHGERGVEFAELVGGVPTTIPQFRNGEGHALATPSADVRPLSPDFRDDLPTQPTLLTTSEAVGSSITGLSPKITAQADLRSIGAALSPLSAWTIEVVEIGNASEMKRAMAAAQARVSARLVSYGALASRVRILESRLAATAYEHPRVISVRVRGVADRWATPSAVKE